MVSGLAVRTVPDVIVSDDVDQRAWDAYVSAHPEATSDHLWGWRSIFDGVFRHRSVYLAALRNGAVVGVLPLVCFRSRLFGRFVVSLPFLNYGGVLASDDAAARALFERARAIAQSFDAAHVEFRQITAKLGNAPLRQHKLLLTRTLPDSPDSLWSTIDRKVRNQVRKAQNEGLTADVGGLERVDDFYGVFARNMRDLGTPVYPKQLFREVLRQFPERARVFVVSHGERPAAAAITIRFRDTVIVPWASSLRELRHLSPNTLLYWTMMKGAVEGGARTFDFGRSSRDSGPHRFKVQWGADEAPLNWEYMLLKGTEAPDQGPSNPRFATAVKAWTRLPLWVANAIGPAIVRNIP